MCVGIKESAMKAYLRNNESFLGDPNRVRLQSPISIVGPLGLYMIYYRLQL